MLQSRPESLASMSYYRHFPDLPITVDNSRLPDLLKFDLLDLMGLLPITNEISDLCPGGIELQPPEHVVRYYERSQTVFSMVMVVANCYAFELQDEILHGYPYAITLFPASKRGEVDRASARTAASLALKHASTEGCVYAGFDPFHGASGLFGPSALLCSSKSTYTDQFGFVIGTYFLADKFDRESVLLPNLRDAPREIAKRYWRWRVKRYFSQFNAVAPRRVWGVETPIELFLLQGLAQHGIHPTPQYLIYSNGEAYASFHDMIAEESNASETPVVTEADLYFPDKRLAVFCDSRQFHRDPLHDAKVVDKLGTFGIRSVRVSGSIIVKELDRAVEMVLEAYRG